MKQALSESTIGALDVVASILIRCFVVTVGAMVFTWIVWLILGDVVYDVHSQLYEVTKTEFDLYFLYTMTIVKGLNLLFFLFPFLAIKWYLWDQR
jgi:hypothetical protein